MQLVLLIGFTKRNGYTYDFMRISLLEINSNLSITLKINFNDFIENFIDFTIEKTCIPAHLLL